jgi:hypothetical protein
LATTLTIVLVCCCLAAGIFMWRSYHHRHPRDSLMYDNGTELGRSLFPSSAVSSNSPFGGGERATESSRQSPAGVPIFSATSFSQPRYTSSPSTTNRLSSGGGFV